MAAEANTGRLNKDCWCFQQPDARDFIYPMTNSKKNLPLPVRPSEVTQADSVQSMRNLILIMDPVGTILEADATFVSRFCIARRECKGANVYDLLESVGAHDLAVQLRVMVDEVLRSGKEHAFDEVRDTHRIRYTVNPVCPCDRGVEKLFVCQQDTAELKQSRKQLDKELAKNKIRFRQALEAASAGVWEWDTITGENIWSDELWALYGLQRGDAPPSFELWESSIHPDDREIAVETVLRSVRGEVDLNVEYRVCHPDGSIHWLMSRGKPERDERAQIVRYIGTIIDITDRKRLEDELTQHHIRWDAILSQWHIGLWEFNLRDHTVTRTLEHARIFGYDSVESEWSLDIFLAHVYLEDRSKLAEYIRNSVVNLVDYAFECRIVRSDGKMRWIRAMGKLKKDESGNPIAMQGVTEDITERKETELERQRLEEQLQQSQKMELLGQLAGGIAHDFNNMLAAIQGNTELVLNYIPSTAPHYKHLDAVLLSVDRSAGMVKQLLAFARKQAIQPQAIELDRELERMHLILRKLIRENISLRWQLNCPDTVVKLDPANFVQIITNLCINASDAIDGQGSITLDTRMVNNESCKELQRFAGNASGKYVRISIVDTGSGIPDQALPHIFEPFFTTKGVGKGTGLGLSMVFGSVKQHNGYITCETDPGKGTRFNLFFPLVLESIGAGDTSTPVPPRLAAPDKPMVLIVEDEPDILKIISHALENAGFDMVSAENAEDAIELARQHAQEIILTVSDVILPGMNGVELSQKLLQLNPTMKFLFISGYSADTLGEYGQISEETNFISKPFSLISFLNMIQTVLRNPEVSL
ncbi:MAG: PAS domain-containing protein [Chlorobiaceae bacterium]|nr:PAS domain-containing protein [Chlorobiaceae bacterium]